MAVIIYWRTNSEIGIGTLKSRPTEVAIFNDLVICVCHAGGLEWREASSILGGVSNIRKYLWRWI